MTNSKILPFPVKACNNFKYTKTEAFDLLTGQNVPLYNPRKDVWAEHFTWNSDFTILVGISPTGRATIELLKLNRESVRNLRLTLHFVGKHPPK